MTKYRPRVGDTRPMVRTANERLRIVPFLNQPFRWLPRHGQPFLVFEWFSQKIIKVLAFLPVYVAIVVTIILLIQLFGVAGYII